MCEGKVLDKLRYHKIKMKCIKIKDARIRNNKIFQEDQGMFYRKTQGTKQLKGKVPKMERVLGRNLGRQHHNPMTKMDEDGCKENSIKIYECAGIDNHRKEVAPNSQETKELVCPKDQWSGEFFMEEV